jgi:HK97 gp10 family phage protein
MSKGIELDGFPDFLKAVERLPDRLKRMELLKVLRREAKPTVQAAKRNVRKKSGKLERSITTITGKSKIYPNILVGPSVKGKNEGFHGHLIEFGHGGPHPAPAFPFMRPAYDETKNQVSKAAAQAVAKYVTKRAKKLNNGS